MARVALNTFSYAYGFTGLVVMGVASLFTLPWKISVSEREKVEHLREKLYNVSTEPIPGYKHAFFTTSRGITLHYLVREVPRTDNSPNPPPTLLFLHGFPDSSFLWTPQLTSPRFAAHRILALDIPGYGGSEALPKDAKMEPDTVLDMFREFIARVAPEGVVLVSHDWGGRIAGTFGFGAPEGMLKGLVVANTAVTEASLEVVRGRTSRGAALLRSGKVGDALREWGPLGKQLLMSYYVFVVNLPYPLLNVFLMKDFLYRTKRSISMKIISDPDDAEAHQHSLASMLGPKEGMEGYPWAGQRRGSDNSDMFEMVRLYREWGFKSWKGADRKLKKYDIPALFVFGTADFALDQSIVTGNLDEVGMEVKLVEGASHWVMFHRGGEAFNEVLEEFVEKVMREGGASQ